MRHTYNGMDCTLVTVKDFHGDKIAKIQRQSWTGAMIYEWVDANKVTEKKA